MGSEVNDEILSKAFSHYSSFVKGKMVKNKQTNKNKGVRWACGAYEGIAARCRKCLFMWK